MGYHIREASHTQAHRRRTGLNPRRTVSANSETAAGCGPAAGSDQHRGKDSKMAITILTRKCRGCGQTIRGKAYRVGPRADDLYGQCCYLRSGKKPARPGRIGAALLLSATLLSASAAQAQVQTYTTTPLYGGQSRTMGPNGWSATTTPTYGGGSTTTVIDPGPLPMLPTLPFQTSPPPIPLQPLVTPNPWGYR